MRLAGAELVESREILPGEWLQAYHAPAVAVGARAGQYVHVRPLDPTGLALRRPFPINTADPAAGRFTIHVRAAGPGGDVLRRLRTGDVLDVTGPFGRPFGLPDCPLAKRACAGGLP